MKPRIWVLVSLIPVAYLAGCATVPPPAPPKAPEEPVARSAPPVIPKPVVVPAHGANQRAKAFLSVERALRKAKGKKVVLSRKLLAELLRAEQLYEAKCARLNGQLEALKNIDTEESKRTIQ
ncbi:MAG TPA: hypothetical protein VJB59_04620 [Bdellovibrionota bacterium]|nr:hypothetical protein [Bdellovibrionota bacterium]